MAIHNYVKNKNRNQNTYHINGKGEPALCRATDQACPLGGAHFDNKEEAQSHVEGMYAQKFGMTSVLSRPARPKNPEVESKRAQVVDINKKVKQLTTKLNDYKKSKGSNADSEVIATVEAKIQEGQYRSKKLRDEMEALDEFDRQNYEFNNQMNEIDNAKIDENALGLFNEAKSTDYYDTNINQKKESKEESKKSGLFKKIRRNEEPQQKSTSEGRTSARDFTKEERYAGLFHINPLDGEAKKCLVHPESRSTERCDGCAHFKSKNEALEFSEKLKNSI